MRREPSASAIVVRLAILLVMAGCVWIAGHSPVSAGERNSGDAGAVTGVWTVRIPDAFPNYVYTWRLQPDGTYEEDGADRETGNPIQATLTGRWSLDGEHMTLRQDNLGYVFEGTIMGKRYLGTLTLGGQFVSAFCAAKGDDAPRRCDEGDVALLTLPGG